MAKRSVPHLQKGELHLQHDTADVLTHRVTLHLITRRPIRAECSIFNINIVYVQCSVSSMFTMTQSYFMSSANVFVFLCPQEMLFHVPHVFVSMTMFFFLKTSNNSVSFPISAFVCAQYQNV